MALPLTLPKESFLHERQVTGVLQEGRSAFQGIMETPDAAEHSQFDPERHLLPPTLPGKLHLTDNNEW